MMASRLSSGCDPNAANGGFVGFWWRPPCPSHNYGWILQTRTNTLNREIFTNWTGFADSSKDSEQHG
jgi:hypothetical protein